VYCVPLRSFVRGSSALGLCDCALYKIYDYDYDRSGNFVCCDTNVSVFFNCNSPIRYPKMCTACIDCYWSCLPDFDALSTVIGLSPVHNERVNASENQTNLISTRRNATLRYVTRRVRCERSMSFNISLI